MDNETKPKIILLVEDDEMYREFLKDLLGSEEHLIEEAGNGAEALEKLQKSSYDLIITDILMPRMDGLEMMVKMKEMDVDTKIIAISGGAAEVNPDSFLYASKILGVSGTLTKPFHGKELITLIDDVLD